MNYILFRIIIFLTFILIMTIVFKLINSVKKRKTFLITIFIIFIIFIFICYYPIENKLFRFSSIDKAFKYYYPSAKIKKKYQYNDYAYVVYDDKKYDAPGLMYLIKNDKSWEINNLLTKGNPKQQMNSSDCIISIINLPKMHSTGIIVYYSLINKKNNGKIYDSLSSTFETYEEENLNTSVVILNERVDRNYTIYFNDKEFKPFDK